jgi:hypothetical protein
MGVLREATDVTAVVQANIEHALYACIPQCLEKPLCGLPGKTYCQ